MTHFLYILASKPRGALHIGRAGNLRQRLDAHRMGFCEHTKRRGITTLVWFEECEGYETSALRERQLKRLRRADKERLIEARNAEWLDISGRVPKAEPKILSGVQWKLRSNP